MRKHVEIKYQDGVMRGYHDCVDSDKLAIITHGIGGNKLGHKFIFKQFAEYANSKQISVLRLDFYGTGESDGDFADTKHSDQVNQLNTIIEYAKANYNYEHIYLCSTTIGCYSVWHASKCPKVKAVVNWNPITDFERYYQNGKKGADETGQIDMKGLRTKPTYVQDLQLLSREIPQIDVPVLLIQGNLDHEYKTGHAMQTAQSKKWQYKQIEDGNHLWEGNRVREELFSLTTDFINDIPTKK